MKIILSRKGFDSSTGGFASPIMPCGRLLSLPIPVTANGEHGIPYANLRFDGRPLTETINQLYNHNHQFPYNQAHLDPDLDRDRYPNRQEGWRPAFGQVGPPQTLLKDVKENDLFLFFGWFRRTRYDNVQLRYLQPRKGGKNLHVIFGWLQVGGKPLAVNGDEIPDWLHYHPHIVNRGLGTYTNNTIYIAADHLNLGGLPLRGAGTFPCFKSSLQLTAPEEEARAHWSLPKWLQNDLSGFTRPHRMNRNWQCCNGHVPFDSDGRGQEFVFNVPETVNQEVIDWLKGLFEDCC